MKDLVAKRVAPGNAHNGSLAEYLVAFAESLRRVGYSQRRIEAHIWIGASFSRWLRQARVPVNLVTANDCARYLQYRARHRRPHGNHRAVLDNFLAFLRREGVIPTEVAKRPTPVTLCSQRYEQYLREVRGLAEKTISNYVPYVQDFLVHRFGNGSVELSKLSSCDIVGCVQRRASQMHTRSAKLLTSALRSFLQYARFCGEVTLDLAAAVPVVANWSMPSIPRAIEPDQSRKLMESIDRNTAKGRRDYAILLLLSKLGLRSGEVTSLELDDIDWNDGRLRVRGKAGLRNELPLPAEVGRAIAAYLWRDRPSSSCRRVFLRLSAPIRGLGSDGIGSMVRYRLIRARIDAPTYGTHQFRYGLATEMLRHGAALAEIGDVLGHRSLETTKVYAKVDLDSLRTLALAWPAGVQ